jgi:hypothetical protein
VILAQVLAPAGTFVITGHSPVHKDRIERYGRPFVELCNHLMAVEIVS